MKILLSTKLKYNVTGCFEPLKMPWQKRFKNHVVTDPQVSGIYYSFPHVRFQVDRPVQYPGVCHNSNCRQLLSKCIHGHDYDGAAHLLPLLYHNFRSYAGECIQASLVILQQLKGDLEEYYTSIATMYAIDQVQVYREFLIHLIHQNQLHDAFDMFRKKIQDTAFSEDVSCCAHFGILCYWLLIRDFPDLRNELMMEPRHEEQDIAPYSSYELYQLACQYLGRTIALAPANAQYLEYYAQLLVLSGQVQTAADYIENFYHANPSNPHAARMMLCFLQKWDMRAKESQVECCLRWIQLDPTAEYALQYIEEYFQDGDCTRLEFILCHLDVIDRCGIDTPNEVWRRVAVQLMEDPDAIYFFLERQWWERVFFSQPEHPRTVPEQELLVYKATIVIAIYGPQHVYAKEVLKIAFHTENLENMRMVCDDFHLVIDDVDFDFQPPAVRIVNKQHKYAMDCMTTKIQWPQSLGGVSPRKMLQRADVILQ